MTPCVCVGERGMGFWMWSGNVRMVEGGFEWGSFLCRGEVEMARGEQSGLNFLGRNNG